MGDHELVTGALGRQRLGDGVPLAITRAHRLGRSIRTYAGAITMAQLLGGLPAAALADRWNRKTIMLSYEAIQAIAAVSVAAVL